MPQYDTIKLLGEVLNIAVQEMSMQQMNALVLTLYCLNSIYTYNMV